MSDLPLFETTADVEIRELKERLSNANEQLEILRSLSKKKSERIAELNQQKTMLIVAVESLRQPHMDYIPALDMTGADLLQTLKSGE